MTTIAFKNGVLAADSQETTWNLASKEKVKKAFIIDAPKFTMTDDGEGGVLSGPEKKKYGRLGGWLFVGAGHAGQIRAMQKFLRNMSDEFEADDISSYEDAPEFDCMEALLMPPVINGTVIVMNGGEIFTQSMPQGATFAMGSGQDVALGALDAGVSSHRAVAISAGRDIYTGFPIRGYEISDEKWVELDQINSLEEIEALASED